MTTLTGRASRSPTPSSTFGRARLLEFAVSLYAFACVTESALGQFSFGRMSRFAALLLVGLALLGRLPRDAPTLKGNSLLAPQAALTILALLSYYWSIDPQVSSSRIVTVVSLLVATLAVMRAGQRLGRQTTTRMVARGLLLGSLGASILIIVADRRGDYFTRQDFDSTAERFSAGGADPNDIALALAVSIPAYLTQRKHRYLWWPMALVVTAALLLTGSRGGLLAAAGAVMALVGAILRRRDTKADHRIARLFALLTLGAGAAVVAPALLPTSLRDRLATIPTELQSGSLTGRRELWAGAVQGFLEHPLTGVGAGTSSLYERQVTGIPLVPHNTLLTIALELGIIGIVTILLIWSRSLRHAWRSTEAWVFPALVALSIGVLALSWDYYKLLWLLLAVAALPTGKVEDHHARA